MSNVIEIGSIKLSKKIFDNTCDHVHIEYDSSLRTVRCSDCKIYIDPFEAFLMLAKNFDVGYKKMQSMKAEIEQAKEKELFLLAAKKIEQAWRSQKMVPACPHCHEAIFANDNFGNTMINKKHAIEKRKFTKKS